MRIDCALLCDAVTVRDGLLHILGGGVTRIARTEYPGPLGVAVAVRLILDPSEADTEHSVDLRLILNEDEKMGPMEVLGRVHLSFGVERISSGLLPDEHYSAALAFPVQDFPLKREGSYRFVLGVNDAHETTIAFYAVRVGDALPTEGSNRPNNSD